MKAYKVIEGSQANLEAFEQSVSESLEMGYVLGGDLIVTPQANELKLFQTLILPEEDFEDEEEWDEEDEDEEEDYEEET